MAAELKIYRPEKYAWSVFASRSSWPSVVRPNLRLSLVIDINQHGITVGGQKMPAGWKAVRYSVIQQRSC